MQQVISEQCGRTLEQKPTVIFEDNAAYIDQVTSSFIKADRMKHISPHIFGLTQDLMESGQIEVRKIKSENNVANMLTKALPAYKHRKLIHDVGMRSIQDLFNT